MVTFITHGSTVTHLVTKDHSRKHASPLQLLLWLLSRENSSDQNINHTVHSAWWCVCGQEVILFIWTVNFGDGLPAPQRWGGMLLIQCYSFSLEVHRAYRDNSAEIHRVSEVPSWLSHKDTHKLNALKQGTKHARRASTHFSLSRNFWSREELLQIQPISWIFARACKFLQPP